jgi:hypothetical protein
MPLVFVHGVNTRDTDPDYQRSFAARKVMFEELVSPAVIKRGFPKFSVAPDIYWGNLGVTFAWGLRVIPDIPVSQSLGSASDGPANVDVMELVLESGPRSTEVQSLGPESPLASAAKRAPAALVRAVFAPEAERFAPPNVGPPATSMNQLEEQKALSQGEHLGLMLIAVEDLARETEKNPSLISANTDDEVITKIQQEVQKRYQARAKARLKSEMASEKEQLGKFGDAIGWATEHLKATIDAAKRAAGFALAKTERGASLLALKEIRQGVSRNGLRFLGDVFVYLQRGKTASPSIYERVREGVKALAGTANDNGQREPLIVVTHSFGSEIFYDVLARGDLNDVPVDLWVTVGAQTSLFAEMQLFAGMPFPLPADTRNYALGRPQTVKKWINFYDAADVLSYLHEPVFGKDAVTDIQVRAQANLTNAHGHYFVDPGFYERVAQEI